MFRSFTPGNQAIVCGQIPGSSIDYHFDMVFFIHIPVDIGPATLSAECYGTASLTVGKTFHGAYY